MKHQVLRLSNEEDILQAAKLARKAWHIGPDDQFNRTVVYYGVKHGNRVIGEIRVRLIAKASPEDVNEEVALRNWIRRHSSEYPLPDVFIESLVVLPEYRCKGIGYSLRKRVQEDYNSIFTATDGGSSQPAMRILNHKMGFVLFRHGKEGRSMYYWSKPISS